MRDRQKPIEYWNDYDKEHQEMCSSELSRQKYQDVLSRKPELNTALHSFFHSAIWATSGSVSYFYSRGDELDDIREKSIVRALENGLFFAQEAPKNLEDKQFFFQINKYDPESYDTYVFLSWCVCFDADPQTVKALAPVIAEAGEDRLVDTILQRYDPERKIADSVKLPKVFGPLEKIMDASEADQVKLIKRYLDKWAVTISKLKGFSGIGGTGGLKKAKSNADLYTDPFIKPNYVGWRAWEVALMVRAFDIDDTSFADHPLYPVELARYRYKPSPVTLWPLAGDPKSDVSVDKTHLDEEKSMFKELLLLVNLGANVPTEALVEGNEVLGFDEEADGKRQYQYLAVDEASARYFGEPSKIVASSSAIEFTVYYSQDENDRQVDQREIARVNELLGGYADRYLPQRDSLDGADTKAMLSHFEAEPSHGMYLPIAAGENWAAWIDAAKSFSDDTYYLTVNYRQLSDTQVMVISGYHAGQSGPAVDEIVKEVESLVEQYVGIVW